MKNSSQLWLALVCCASLFMGITVGGCTSMPTVKYVESPVPLEVTVGMPVSELRLPTKAMVSNGQQEQREITRDMSQVPLYRQFGLPSGRSELKP